ncbi:MAG: hypothetical protein KAI95_18335 [Bacteroidales bacterium]|nr:hypothetical protein [Bacteroidales bacterium]
MLAFLAYSCEDLLGPDTGDDRDSLVDTWKVIEESSPLKSEQGAYWVEIEKHPDKQDMVLIYFFHGLGDDVYAEASLSGSTLTLGSQVLQGGWTIQGSGEIQKNWNEINWTYTADDGSSVKDQVTAVYTRIGL